MNPSIISLSTSLVLPCCVRLGSTTRFKFSPFSQCKYTGKKGLLAFWAAILCAIDHSDPSLPLVKKSVDCAPLDSGYGWR